MANVIFVPDAAELTYFKSWAGPIGRAFRRLERETVWRQKQLAHKKTGALAASVTSKHGKATNGLVFDAGSWTVSYAIIHELGSKPHLIVPKNAPALVFFWPKAGKVVALKSVKHPGTRPYHFLTEGLEAAMRMWERGS